MRRGYQYARIGLPYPNLREKWGILAHKKAVIPASFFLGETIVIF